MNFSSAFCTFANQKYYHMQHQLSRRKFLSTAVLGSAVWAMDKSWPLAGGIQPGLQLWSVRDDLKKDPAGTLKALRAMGYRKLEGFGFDSGKMGGLPLADFFKLLKDNGISMPSTHCKFQLGDYNEATKDISDNAKKIIDEAAKLGVTRMAYPHSDEKERVEIVKLVKLLEASAAYAAKSGVRLAYHNHDFEFKTKGPDGRLSIEWFLQEIDPAHFDMEMDLYWVAYAGYNPLDWFRLYPGRWKMCHVKDMAKTEKRETIEVGDGSINFREIFQKKAQAGFLHYFIELENYRTSPMEGVNRARTNFVKLGLR